MIQCSAGLQSLQSLSDSDDFCMPSHHPLDPIIPCDVFIWHAYVGGQLDLEDSGGIEVV